MTDTFTPLRAPVPPPRILPINPDAEQYLLGAVLCSNRLLDHVAEIVRPEHFGNGLHARIYTALRKLIERGDVASPVTLKPLLDQDPVLTEFGGARYLAQLAQAGARLLRSEAEFYARIVHDCWLRRELIALLEEHTAAAYRLDLDDPATQQLERLEEALRRLAEGGETGGFQPLSVATGEALAIAQAAYQRGAKITGVPSSFVDLDNALGGLHPGDLVILAARPSMGKTALATTIAINAAKNGESVGFFSLEMAAAQLGGRVLAGESRIPADWVRRGDLNQEHFDKLLAAKRQTDDLPLHIDETPALPVAAMQSRARRLKRRHGLDLVITDYLQLAQAPRPEGRSEQNRVQEVSEISRALKRFAKDLDVPVLALSQLSRAVEQRDDKRPQLADLRESGAIEQDADVVMFLFREEYYLREPDPADADKWTAWRDKQQAVHNKAELIIGKNRHGPTSTVQLYFDHKTTQFSDLTRGFD